MGIKEDITQSCTKQQEAIEKMLTGETTEQLTELIMENIPEKEHSLTPKGQQKEQIKLGLQDIIKSLLHTIDNGVDKLLSGTVAYCEEHPEVDGSKIPEAMLKVAAFTASIDPENNMWLQGALQGKETASMLDISDETLTLLYKGAKYHYEKKAYEDARDAFSIMLFLSSNNVHFWHGLAHSTFFLEDYEKASFFYAMAAYLDIGNPQCHYFCALCYEKEGDKDLALNAIDLALFACDQDEQYKELRPVFEEEKKRLAKM